MIRPYEQKDWDDVCRIHDSARVLELSHGAVDAQAFRPMRVVANEDGFHKSETLVFCVGKQLTGFVSWNGDYITWLYVDPVAHRKGVGKQLLNEALNRIGQEAWTSVLADNLPARLLYESAGMELVWVRPSLCDGYACNLACLALPTNRMNSQGEF